MRTIALVSEKGGVAKTVTTLNVAACLARSGCRVLVIDADPQHNASLVLLRGESARRPTLLEVLMGQADARDAVVSTATTGVALLPADATLAEANVALVGELGRERRLRTAIESLDGDYDAVLVDTPPTRSLLTVNALNAVRDAVIPVAPGLFSLSGLALLWGVVEEVRRHLDNKSLRVAGLILTMVERNNVSRDLEEQLRDAYGPLVYRETIPRSVKVEEAVSRYESVITYAPRSAAAKAYIGLTGEIIGDVQREQGAADGARDRGDEPAEADGRAA